MYIVSKYCIDCIDNAKNALFDIKDKFRRTYYLYIYIHTGIAYTHANTYRFVLPWFGDAVHITIGSAYLGLKCKLNFTSMMVEELLINQVT